MAFFMQRERHLSTNVLANTAITFETEKNKSFTPTAFKQLPDIQSLLLDDPTIWDLILITLPPSDIFYHETGVFAGSFDFYLPGSYLISWNISQMSGLSQSGQFLELRYYDETEENWKPLSTRGIALKLSASVGIAILNVTTDDLNLTGFVRIALWNQSDKAFQMNRTPHLKATISIYGFAPSVGDPDAIREEILQRRLYCCDGADIAIAQLKKRLEDIKLKDEQQQLIIGPGYPSPPGMVGELRYDWEDIQYQIQNYLGPGNTVNAEELTGITVSYVRTGYSYNFWASGLTTNSIVVQGATAAIPVKIPLITSTNPICTLFRAPIPPEVALYQKGFQDRKAPLSPINRPAVAVPCYYSTVTNTAFAIPNFPNWIPLWVNETGIYLAINENVTIPSGTRFRFSLTVVFNELVDDA